MKRTLLSLVLALTFCQMHAQDFAGYRAGNYTGVNGVFFNPANIADSRYRFDINLVSVSTVGGNNQASFNIKNLVNTFNTDSLENQLFGKSFGNSSGLLSADIHGPSLMFNAGSKFSVALTTRARVMANIRDVDGKLVDKLREDFESDPSLPYTIASGNNMRVNANAWTEYGLSLGSVITDQGAHFFKAGVTFKYMAGIGNAYLHVNQFRGTLNEDRVQQDAYLSNSTGGLAVGFGGASISDFDVEDFKKMESTGFGGDIGFVYEFRPDHETYKYGKEDDYRRDLNKYKLKVGVALLDIGSIKYKKDLQRTGGYNIDIAGAERFYLKELNDLDFDDYKAFFNGKPQYFTPVPGNNASDYTVSLPTTLQLDLDYHFHRGFYLNLASQFAFNNSESKPYNSAYYHSFTVTPRYEGRAVGLYVPLNYNELTSFNAGLSVRLGPLFFGSGSVLTALFGDSKQADMHIGLRFGGLQKNMAKKMKKQEIKRSKREFKKSKT